MAFDLSSLIGGSIGDAFQKIVGAFKVDPTKALEAQTQLEEIKLQLQSKIIDQVNAQIEVNKVEAASPHVFVAGWRPAVGWICAIGLGMQFVVAPFATWGAELLGHTIKFPTLDMQTLLTLLGGMLGLAGLRTGEKVAGIDTKNFS